MCCTHAGEPTYIVIWDWDKMGRDGRARDPQDVTFVTAAKLVQDLHAAAARQLVCHLHLQNFSRRCNKAREWGRLRGC